MIDYKVEAWKWLRDYWKIENEDNLPPLELDNPDVILLANFIERLCGEASKEQGENFRKVEDRYIDEIRDYVLRLAAAQKEIERLRISKESWQILHRNRFENAVKAEERAIKAEVAIEQGKDEKQAAENLLAVLHRDGGHHTGKVGFIQSCRDGELVRHDLMRQIEQAREEGFRECDGQWQMAVGFAVTGMEREKAVAQVREEGWKAGMAEGQSIAFDRGKEEGRREQRGAIYPCADCGVMRTEAEGGTTFTVCDDCWDKHFRPEAKP